MQLPEWLVTLALAFALDPEDLLGGEGPETEDATLLSQQDPPDAGEWASCPRARGCGCGGLRGGGVGWGAAARAGPRLTEVSPRCFAMSDCAFRSSNKALRSEIKRIRERTLSTPKPQD